VLGQFLHERSRRVLLRAVEVLVHQEREQVA
jgi:hypothetical protein